MFEGVPDATKADRGSLDQQPTGIGGDRACEDFDERALACTVLAREGVDFAGKEREVHLLKSTG